MRSAADVRAELRNSIPAASVTQSADISIANTGADVAITWNTENYDRWGMASLGGGDNDKITIVVPGIYLVTGNACFQADANGYRRLRLFQNGTGGTLLAQVSHTNAGAAIVTGLALSVQVRLTKGDYVGMYAAQNSTTGALNIVATGVTTDPHLEVTWMAGY